jgi:TonB family protein
MRAVASARAAHGSVVSLLALGLVACGGTPSREPGAAPAQARVDAGAGPLTDNPGPRLGLLGPETIGLGNLGTTCECPSSAGVNGSDSDHRRDPPERLPSAPIDPLPPETRGGLDREIVRRVVRRHGRELLACYPVAARERNVGGMLMVDFTIASSGEVRAASLRHQTLGDDQIASCFVDAIRAWRFPRPRHGEETVVAQRFTLFPRRGPSPWPRHETRQ